MVYKSIYQDLSLVITLVTVERLGSLHDASSVPVIWRIPRRNGNKTARTGTGEVGEVGLQGFIYNLSPRRIRTGQNWMSLNVSCPKQVIDRLNSFLRFF